MKKRTLLSTVCALTVTTTLLQSAAYAADTAAQPVPYNVVLESAPVTSSPVSQRDFDVLYRDLDGIPTSEGSWVGGVAAIGETAFAVAAHPDTTPFIGASYYGTGRVLVAGDEAYFKLTTDQADKKGILARNIMHWMTEGLSKTYADALNGNGSISLITKTEDFEVPVGVPVNVVKVASWADKDASGSPLLDPAKNPVAYIDYQYVSEEERPLLEAYVRNGGRLIVTIKGWVLEQFAYVSLPDGRETASLNSDYPIQRLLNTFGLSLMNSVASSQGGTTPILTAELSNHYHTVKVMTEAKAVEAGTRSIDDVQIGFPGADTAMKLKVLSATLSGTFTALTPVSSIYETVHTDSAAIQQDTLPINPIVKPYSGALLPVVLDRIYRDPSGTKSPFADAFPGKVPDDAPVVNGKTIEVDYNYSTFDYLRMGYPPQNWISTGLYAPAGKEITVEVPAGTANLEVQIGAHTDSLSNLPLQQWVRAPLITRKMQLKPGTNKIANPYGGLVYIIPTKPDPGVKIQAKISGAVNAPYYIMGQTNLDDWKNTIRNYPAPWAELNSGRAIITVPTEYVRSLDNPDEVLKKWNEMIDGMDRLAGLSPDQDEPHRSPNLSFRYVGDAEISGGWLHAGYPIMFHVNGSAIDAVTVYGMEGLQGWGWWHETGHEYQQLAWTWGAVVEATVNIYSLYAQEMFGSGSRLNLLNSNGKSIYDLAFDFINSTDPNKDFNKDKYDGTKTNDVWNRLVMFKQLQLAYGWEFYTKMHKLYREIPEGKTLMDASDQEKVDLFVIKASEISGNNLLEFFDKWALKYTDAAKQKVLAMNLPKPAVPVWTLREAPNKLTGITLDKTELDLNLGSNKSAPLTATVSSLPDAGDVRKDVVWFTSNPSVATVDKNGVVTAVGEGKAKITASTWDAAYKTTAQVVVDNAPPVITSSTVTMSVYQTEPLQIGFTISDAGSGVQSSEVKLDGALAGNPLVIEPLTLAPGDHVIQVLATDKAGNRTESEFTLSVTLDIDHLDKVLTLAGGKGWITNEGVLNSLQAKVKQMQKQQLNGKEAAELLNALANEVTAQAGRKIVQPFADLLLADIAYLADKASH
ncbi:M60 family metallopeptidase [Paenibacillus sp. KQZ6P-2]|uniref:M60 family metallopeptidase n=1 Tax=Paenibacillus mangrovi TaxID=2931978 RepID=A0A9X1WME8_9BACL|nr:M60 family metallopeptidase [Paenibacillus mangrovi]MCJ8011618.1 M60 family metallopeptidase [Paenibacillus mangrovi]